MTDQQDIVYSQYNLQRWVDEGLLTSEMQQVALERLVYKEALDRELQELSKSNPTDEKLFAWMDAKNKEKDREFWSKFNAFLEFITDNRDKLKQVLSQSEKHKKYFALPSHSIMFSLIALFAGKPEKIPSLLLEKDCNERTEEEQKAVDKYLSSIWKTSVERDYSEGRERIVPRKVALICNNAKVEGKAEIRWNLFHQDLSFREEQLAKYIKRTFGPEGIRHLLGLIIGLEENGRTGAFEWSVNEHLERLGYKKKANRSYDVETRKMASEIVKIFTGLCITSIRKSGKKESFHGKFLFMVEGLEIQAFEKEIIDEKIQLVATDFWYQNAFSPQDGKAPQYTKLLKEIVKENHREHPLTLYMAPLLAIFWRMNPEQKISLRNLMEWCDLDMQTKYRLRNVEEVEASLDYMKIKGYLGKWSHNGKAKKLRDNKDPFNLCLTLSPPDWLKQERKSTRRLPNLEILQKEPILDSGSTQALSVLPLDQMEFKAIFQQTGLTVDQFGQHLGVTGQYISLINNGRRAISQKIAARVRDFQSNLQAEQLPLP